MRAGLKKKAWEVLEEQRFKLYTLAEMLDRANEEIKEPDVFIKDQKHVKSILAIGKTIVFLYGVAENIKNAVEILKPKNRGQEKPLLEEQDSEGETHVEEQTKGL